MSKSILVPAVLLVLLASCGKQDGAKLRTDRMSFHLKADCSDDAVSEACVSLLGGEKTIYLKSDYADVSIFWQDAAGQPWAKVISCEKTGMEGVTAITLGSDERSESVLYTRRSGTLTAVAASENYGLFMAVHQGGIARVYETFSDWTYGSSDPYSFAGDVMLDYWTTSLKDKGFTSEPVAPDTLGRCYGRVGFLRRGDSAGHRGSVLTPRNERFRYDSLLMVSFKAAAYKDKSSEDDAQFRVEVVGGGVIRDLYSEEGSSVTFTAPYIDTKLADFWNGGNFLVFVCGTPNNPITASTRIKIVSGTGSTAGNGRLFIDELSITKIVPDLDEDFFEENGGSGQDKIMAKR